MKYVLFSDLHLDAPFTWAPRAVARARRQALRDTLERIVDLTIETGADALFCAGDLYEHERFSPDTAAFVRQAFARLHPIPVFVAPGNHDWLGPASLYHRVEFTPNVHVFSDDTLTPVELADGLTLWGAAHRAPANTDGFVERFHVDRGGIHLALFHGSELGGMRFQESTKEPHAPFTAEQLASSGLHHAFVGHFHTPRDAERYTYPGNPDPLCFGETGDRGAVEITVAADGSIGRQRHRVSGTEIHDVDVDVTGCTSRQDVRAAVAESLKGRRGLARVTIEGELAPQVEMVLDDLRDTAPWLDEIVLRRGALNVAYEVDAIAAERTVRGQFVRDVRQAELDPIEAERIIVTGLRALDGRHDLEVA